MAFHGAENIILSRMQFSIVAALKGCLFFFKPNKLENVKNGASSSKTKKKQYLLQLWLLF